jgi:hypothetical protein
MSQPALPAVGPEDAVWMARARPVEDFLCDAGFSIADSFYFGPANGFSKLEWQELRAPLPPPALPCRVPGLVVTADLLGREDVLAAHYERLIAIAAAHGRTDSLHKPFPYFAVRPRFIGEGCLLARFSWTDDVAETKAVLEALAASKHDSHGIIWDDVDQGWEIRIATAGPVTCFVEWDAEGLPPADAAYAVDAAMLARQAADALDRMETIHAHLVSALGRDYWSYHRAAAPPRTGGIRRITETVLAAIKRRSSRRI